MGAKALGEPSSLQVHALNVTGGAAFFTFALCIWKEDMSPVALAPLAGGVALSKGVWLSSSWSEMC